MIFSLGFCFGGRGWGGGDGFGDGYISGGQNPQRCLSEGHSLLFNGELGKLLKVGMEHIYIYIYGLLPAHRHHVELN